MIGLRVGPRIGPVLGPKIGASDNPASLSTTTTTTAITDSADPVLNAMALSFAVTVTNTGGVTATSVSCAVTLDSHLTYVSSSGTGWATSQSGGVVTCTRATLSVGAAPVITVNVTAANVANVAATTTAATSCANASTSNGSQGTTLNFVTQDATSLIYVPSSAAEWTAAMTQAGLATGNPVNLYLSQEASGNAADSIGAVTLTANATPAYQQAVTGWTRKAFGFNQTAAQRFLSASVPNPSTTSTLYLAYAAVTGAQGATRDIFVLSTGASPLKFQGTTAPKPNVIDNATNTAGGTNFVTTLQPMVLKFNRTGGVCTAYTGQEKITTVYDATITGGSGGWGAGTGSSFLGLGAYLAIFSGSAAELSDAQVKTLLTTLGWSIPWT